MPWVRHVPKSFFSEHTLLPCRGTTERNIHFIEQLLNCNWNSILVKLSCLYIPFEGTSWFRDLTCCLRVWPWCGRLNPGHRVGCWQCDLLPDAGVDALCHRLKVVGVALTPAKHEEFAVSVDRVVVKPSQRRLALALAQGQAAYRVLWLVAPLWRKRFKSQPLFTSSVVFRPGT